MTEEERIAELRRAVERLREAVAAGADNSLFIDAAIQRFEFCVELAWKSLSLRLASQHGVVLASPKPVLQEAYRLQLIDAELLWLAMLRDRNLSSHTHREPLAREIHARLPDYLTVLERLAAVI
jgi:nucleotidyltransferase substrate binding protein (TIGR01987 family)